MFGQRSAAGTPEPLAYTRPGQAEFLLVYILDRTPKIYACIVVAIFLKLLIKFDDLPILSFLVAIQVSQVETKIFNQLVSFRDNGSIQSIHFVVGPGTNYN